MIEKKSLRAEMLQKRKRILNKETKSQQIVDKVIQSDIYQQAKVIGLYKPLKDEVDINPLIDYSLALDKIVLLPKVINNNLFFIQVTKKTILKKSSFNVLEPTENDVYNGNIDLIIVPGLAFDYDNNRLGYGKGYYDRFLKRQLSYKIGVCFKEQMQLKVPVNKDDVKLDLIIYS